MKTVMQGNEKPAHASMPGVLRVAALLKRWLPSPDISNQEFLTSSAWQR